MKIPIGIDLGTTTSVVAHVTDEGTVEILKNNNGDILTPSVVYFESAGSVIVGAEANTSGPVAPDRVVAAIKRKMGADFSLDFDGVSYRPEGISAVILRALTEAAARELGVHTEDLISVVTVPAYFGTAEREATASAARIAGLKILDLVVEPVAAALSYRVSSEDSESVLVYDLGGGTFDVTVIKLDRRWNAGNRGRRCEPTRGHQLRRVPRCLVFFASFGVRCKSHDLTVQPTGVSRNTWGSRYRNVETAGT